MFRYPFAIHIRSFVVRIAQVAATVGIATTLVASARAEEIVAARTVDQSRGNSVTQWNSVALDAFAPTEGTNPMMQSRTLAILHAAIHDALNAIDRRFAPYTPGLAATPAASPDAAVATAAHEVLGTLVPEQAKMIDAAYERALASISDGPGKTAGIATGKAAARATLARREGDGSESAAQPVYVPQPGSGEYQFTAPFTFALLPEWGRVRPFVIDLKKHNVRGPQPLSSAQYARDLAYVKAIGGMNSTTRTAEQSEIARFWYEDSPLGWNRIANTVVRQQGLDSWTSARVLALVNFAMADGFIAGFEAKYRFRFWRPVTAIGQTDPSWQPFLTTPPVPDYPSTHTVLGWAAAQVLIELLGDKVQYSATSPTLPEVTRSYKGFSAAAEQNGLSRVYAGIHFQHAVKDGGQQGRSIGRAVVQALAPVR
jgi:hypothetical protein